MCAYRHLELYAKHPQIVDPSHRTSESLDVVGGGVASESVDVVRGLRG